MSPENSMPPGGQPASENAAADDHRSHSLILKGIIAAIIVGVLLGGFLPAFAVKFSLLGEAFLNALMMIVVPVVVLSMIVGITGLGDIRKLGSIGSYTVLYYLLTTGMAVLIGIILVNIIQPGRGITPGEEHPGSGYRLSGPDLHSVTLVGEPFERTGYEERYILILDDQNVEGVIDSMSERTATVRYWTDRDAGELFYLSTEEGDRLPFTRRGGTLVFAEPGLEADGTGVRITLPAASGPESAGRGGLGTTLKEVLIGDRESGRQGLIPRNLFQAMADMEILPLIVFSLLIGGALTVLGERVKPTIDLISTLNDAVMELVHWIMIVAPLGIFGLIAARIGQAGGFSGFVPELMALGKYSFTVLLGLAVHGLVVLPLILRLVGRRAPGAYARGVGAAILNAFSTASSSATLPLTLHGVEEENGISNRTASFVLPLGATINMDGTALYESVAAIFIAQVYGISLNPALQAVIFFTATLAAIGAAGIPQAGLVTMVIVLKAVNLPVEGIGLLLTVDWLLDRFRTSVNVWGDSVGAGVVETLEARDEQAPTDDSP